MWRSIVCSLQFSGAIKYQDQSRWWGVDGRGDTTMGILVIEKKPSPPFSQVTSSFIFAGELKQPSRAIPIGTIIAVIITFFVYLILFLLTALTCDRSVIAIIPYCQWHGAPYFTKVSPSYQTRSLDGDLVAPPVDGILEVWQSVWSFSLLSGHYWKKIMDSSGLSMSGLHLSWLGSTPLPCLLPWALLLGHLASCMLSPRMTYLVRLLRILLYWSPDSSSLWSI